MVPPFRQAWAPLGGSAADVGGEFADPFFGIWSITVICNQYIYIYGCDIVVMKRKISSSAIVYISYLYI